MMIKCLAVDDEPYALEQIVGYINKTSFLELSGKCRNSFEVIDFLETKKVDLLFLDINMPELSGMELVKSLSTAIPVIFTTAYEQHAVESYRVDAVDYLLKPITYEDFFRAANKAQKIIAMRQDSDSWYNTFMFVHSAGKIIRIAFSEIDYIESSNEYVKFVLSNRTQVTSLSRLKNIEARLPGNHFLRVHRSFIVNLNHVTTIERNRIVFHGNTYIPIGEQFKAEFRNFIDKTFI